MHDFNPGIAASGLFWTVAVPDDSVDVHPGAGTARFALSRPCVARVGDPPHAKRRGREVVASLDGPRVARLGDAVPQLGREMLRASGGR